MILFHFSLQLRSFHTIYTRGSWLCLKLHSHQDWPAAQSTLVVFRFFTTEIPRRTRTSDLVLLAIVVSRACGPLRMRIAQ